MSSEAEADDGRAARSNISQTLRAAIWQAHGRRCAYTGEPVSLTDLEIDHIIPISISPEDLDKLKSDGVIPTDFDLNDLSNLLPTTDFQNSRKRANLRNRSALFHFVGMAEQYRPAVEAYVQASSNENRLLNAYLNMKAQADRNDLAIEDIVDIHRQQAEGLTRVRHTPELAGVSDLTLLNAELAKELMTKPFALGGGGITEVVLQDDAGQQTVCRDCLSFLAAKDKGLWPNTQLDINCFGMADRNCELLRSLEHARFAPASLIRYPRITCRNLDRWSSKWVQRVWIEFDDSEDAQLFARCPTIADLVSAGACRVEAISDWNFQLEPAKGLALSLSELLRADLDGNGAEEILVFNLAYAPHGTFRAGSVEVVRPATDGLIYPDEVDEDGATPGA